jgi:hypothetical protein
VTIEDVRQAERLVFRDSPTFQGTHELYDPELDRAVARIFNYRQVVVVEVKAAETWLIADLAEQMADRLQQVAAAAKKWEGRK